MKINKILGLIAAVLISIAGQSQSFSGVIKGSVKALKVPAEMQGMESMLTQELSITLKGAKAKTELKNFMGSNTFIYDTLSREYIVLNDMMGQKIAMKKTLGPGENSQNGFMNFEGTNVSFTKETKSISGYTCKKAVVSQKEEGQEELKMEVWYTDQIQEIDPSSPIPGMLMEYLIEIEGMQLQYTTTSITKGAVSDSEFTIPEGYTLKTEDEFQQSFPTIGE
jgi:GLPGLI family protein